MNSDDSIRSCSYPLHSPRTVAPITLLSPPHPHTPATTRNTQQQTKTDMIMQSCNLWNEF